MTNNREYRNWMLKLQNSGKMQERNSWVIKTIDGRKKDEEIFIHNRDFILISNDKWRSTDDIDKLHLLCFYKNRSIRTIRDLKGCNLSILKRMKDETVALIQERFGLNEDEIRIFFHYPPTTYILHIHFMHISFEPRWNEILFDDVINWLESNPNYFDNVEM